MITLIPTLSHKWAREFLIFNIFVLFLVVLLSKDPFSGQNAISELEPSPDTVHYLSPIKSLFDGHGFAITYQGRSIPTQVPPLYTLSLIPFYGLFHDIRSFYFLNVFLMILSAYIFLKVILVIFTDRLIQMIVFFGFCSNFILFWYPSYPMPENLLIFLSTVSFLLLIPPVSQKKAVLVGLMAALMYATKYVAWIEGLGLVAGFAVSVYFSTVNPKNKIQQIGICLIALIIGLFLSILFEYLTKGSDIITKIGFNLTTVWHLISQSSSGGSIGQSTLFVKAPFWDNITRYSFGLIGGPVTIAGQGFSIVSPIIGMGGLLSVIVLSQIPAAKRWLFFYIAFSIFGSLLYLSAFQIVDARYFLAFIPGLTLLFGFGLQGMTNFLEKYQRQNFGGLLLMLLSLILFGFTVPSLAQGFKTNLTHSDASQNYQNIVIWNNYFLSHHFDKQPTVITLLSPYQIDFFSNRTYQLLPLSKRQYFTNSEPQTWNIPVNLKYPDLYRTYLTLGKPLFISNFHTNKDFIFWKEFQDVLQNFQLTKVADGCNGDCNLYQIDSPKAKLSY